MSFPFYTFCSLFIPTHSSSPLPLFTSPETHPAKSPPTPYHRLFFKDELVVSITKLLYQTLIFKPKTCVSVCQIEIINNMTSQDSQSFQWRYDELDDKNFEIHGRTLFFIIVLFSVILLTTLLFLYARWICKPFSSSSVAADSRSTTVLSSYVQQQGLDAAVIDSLPITLHRVSTCESECCICLGVFEEGEKVKVLPNCFHGYHCECVDKWLTTHSSCPICRAAIRVDSPVWLSWFFFRLFSFFWLRMYAKL